MHIIGPKFLFSFENCPVICFVIALVLIMQIECKSGTNHSEAMEGGGEMAKHFKAREGGGERLWG